MRGPTSPPMPAGRSHRFHAGGGSSIAFVGLLEPLLILVMGGLVLVIVLAIMLPIFNINQLIQ